MAPRGINKSDADDDPQRADPVPEVAARPLRRMTAQQADEAAARYLAGEGLADLAWAYQVNTATVRYHLLQRGVAMRRVGRPRGPVPR